MDNVTLPMILTKVGLVIESPINNVINNKSKIIRNIL